MPRHEARSPRRTRWLLLGCAVIADAWAVWPLAGARLDALQPVRAAAETTPRLASAFVPAQVAPARSPVLPPAAATSPAVWQAPAAERLHAAREQLVRVCMASRGFDYRPRPYSPDAAADASQPLAADDPEYVSIHGYGLLDRLVQPEADAPELASLSSAQRKAYDRALKGGDYVGSTIVRIARADGSQALWDRASCLAQAERALFGDDLRYERARLVQEQQQAQDEEVARSDVDYMAGVDRFARCMQAHGLPYTTPRAGEFMLYEAHERGELSLDALGQQEIAVASVEASCRAAAKLDELWRTALERAAPEEVREAVAELAELEQHALQHAAELLAR